MVLSHHHGLVDVVFATEVLLLNSTWSGKPMIHHHHPPWETCTHTAAINNGRRIPIDHRGEPRPLCVCLCVCGAHAHTCYYPLSSWTSFTTSSWIIQHYKIKEHPCACWRINGLINDEREYDKPKRATIVSATLIYFLRWHCVCVSAKQYYAWYLPVCVEKAQRCTQTYT